MTMTEAGSGVAAVSVSGPAGVDIRWHERDWAGSFALGTYTLTGTAGATTVATLALDILGAYNLTLLARSIIRLPGSKTCWGWASVSRLRRKLET